MSEPGQGRARGRGGRGRSRGQAAAEQPSPGQAPPSQQGPPPVSYSPLCLVWPSFGSFVCMALCFSFAFISLV